jgi:hypothetical protein
MQEAHHAMHAARQKGTPDALAPFAAQIIAEVLNQDQFVQDRKILREFYFDNVQAGESAPRFYSAMREAITAHSVDAARAKSLAESGTGPRFEHRP